MAVFRSFAELALCAFYCLGGRFTAFTVYTPADGSSPVTDVQMAYQPQPIDTGGVLLPAELQELTERLSENAHDVWAAQRMSQGWRLGIQRDDVHRLHPCLVAYSELTEAEKDYDRQVVLQTLKAILALGYRILPPSP